MGIILFSFFLFPATFYYFSPVVIIRATMFGIVNGSFIVFSLMFASALVLGRAFCAWVCPAAGCQETIFLARNKKVTKGNFVKWILWIPWISAIVIVAIAKGGYHKIDFFYATSHGLSIGDVGILIVYLIILFNIITATGNKNACCTKVRCNAGLIICRYLS
jgi:polyferredoxin